MSQAILKALEKNPADRFQDFKAFREALLGWDGKSTIEHTGPMPNRLGMPDKEVLSGVEAAASADAITIPPDYFQVGMAVMNLFMDTLKKNQKKTTGFTLHQNGLKLKLTVNTKDGKQQSIVKDMQKILGSTRSKQES